MPGLSDGSKELESAILTHSLELGPRRKTTDIFNQLLHFLLRRYRGVIPLRHTICRPNTRDVLDENSPKLISFPSCLRSKMHQNSIELIDVNAELLQLGILRIVGGMRRGY